MSQSQPQKQDITLEFKAYIDIGSLSSLNLKCCKSSCRVKVFLVIRTTCQCYMHVYLVSIGSLESTVGIIGGGVCLMNSTNRKTSSVSLNLCLCCNQSELVLNCSFHHVLRKRQGDESLGYKKTWPLYSLNSRESEAQQHPLIFLE